MIDVVCGVVIHNNKIYFPICPIELIVDHPRARLPPFNGGVSPLKNAFFRYLTRGLRVERKIFPEK
jgi:hypothetical protein